MWNSVYSVKTAVSKAAEKLGGSASQVASVSQGLGGRRLGSEAAEEGERDQNGVVGGSIRAGIAEADAGVRLGDSEPADRGVPAEAVVFRADLLGPSPMGEDN